MNNEDLIRTKFLAINPTLNELSRRIWVATEANALGRGGISLVFRATGVNRNTIMKGIKELKTKKYIGPHRLRRKGGGRKKVTEKNPRLERSILELVESTSSGDPENPLRYTTKSVRKLQQEIEKRGYKISYPSIAEILHENKFSIQANSRSVEGKQNPDRNAQFEFINQDTKTQIAKKEPVISVDAKKKELVGNFKNNGKEWKLKGNPTPVNVHDFENKILGKVAPYGVYDIDKNKGWINLGIDHDTAEFAVESIRKWWVKMGKAKYQKAKTQKPINNGVIKKMYFDINLPSETKNMVKNGIFAPEPSKTVEILGRTKVTKSTIMPKDTVSKRIG